ncbi:hypothetical protein ACFONN_10355 [Dyella humi]|uniref:Lipoprotein n=1 Tax=Dyella humi TaxID=1770547 RepID=A0ABW8IJL7_9GAMM
MKNRISHIKAAAAMIVALGLCSPAAWANQYREATLGQKVASSDVVLIGQVTSTSPSDCLASFNCATIKIVKQLKGGETSKVVVLFDGPIAEENPLCCKTGVTYLFFLKRAKAGYYVSANGPYGIYQTN